MDSLSKFDKKIFSLYTENKITEAIQYVKQRKKWGFSQSKQYIDAVINRFEKNETPQRLAERVIALCNSGKKNTRCKISDGTERLGIKREERLCGQFNS